VTLAEIADRIGGTILAASAEVARREVLGGYAGDLLSDVMANSREGDVWVTIQKHVNVVAVAQLQGLAGIVLVNGRQPEPDMLKRAEEEHIPVISTPLQAFEVAGTLHSLGIRGRRAT
jgi:predicted transcriptional regulator